MFTQTAWLRPGGDREGRSIPHLTHDGIRPDRNQAVGPPPGMPRPVTHMCHVLIGLAVEVHCRDWNRTRAKPVSATGFAVTPAERAGPAVTTIWNDTNSFRAPYR